MPEAARDMALAADEYQEIGSYFLANGNRAFLGDDAGLGKTLQALLAAQHVGATRLLILCPAVGRVSWPIELDKWTQTPVLVVEKTTKQIPAGPVAVIIGFEMVARQDGYRRVHKLLRSADHFDAAIIDEAHNLRNPKANRTKAVYGGSLSLKNCLLDATGKLPDCIWPMSGDPQVKHAGDLFPHLRALFPDTLRHLERPTFGRFVERYCDFFDGDYGRQITGNNRKTMPELTDLLRPHFLVRKKKDVLKNLAEPRFVPVHLPVDVSLLSENQEADERLADQFEGDGYVDNPPNASERWRELSQIKLDPAVDWIKDFLDVRAGRKLVVFAHHTDLLTGLQDRLPQYHPVLLNGATPTAHRARFVDAFQNDPDCRLFVGQNLAAGTSITLTAASDVLMLEPEWLPTNNWQPISRVHRRGQTEPVTVWWAQAHGTIDDRISAASRRRTKDIAQVDRALGL